MRRLRASRVKGSKIGVSRLDSEAAPIGDVHWVEDPANLRQEAVNRLAAALDIPRELLNSDAAHNETMLDAPTVDMCACDRFNLWYTNDENTDVCSCGHPPAEHIDDRLTCVGTVIVLPGRDDR